MSISPTSSAALPSVDSSQGAAVFSAALAKNQQKSEGAAALQLIQGAAVVAPQSVSAQIAPSPGRIDVWV